MKGLKIFLIALAALVVGGGAAYLIFQKANTSKEEIKLGGSTVKEQSVEKDINDKIINASDASFCKAEYDRIAQNIDLYFRDEPTNLSIYTLKLNNAYTAKFVKQANYVFSHNQWRSSDLQTIRSEQRRMAAISPDNTELTTIAAVLRQYDDLVGYESRVSALCRLEPRSKTNPAALYLPSDKWDTDRAAQLMNEQHNYSGRVQNAPVYNRTRPTEVKKRLKAAHEAFINAKMAAGENEAHIWNHNPNKHTEWEKLGRQLYKDFDAYRQLWPGSNTSDWQRQLASWEQYAMP